MNLIGKVYAIRSLMTSPHNVGIIGAGSISQGYDEPNEKRILSVAHAIRESDRFALGGFLDKETGRAEHAEQKWACPPSPRDRYEWLEQDWDIIYIATPTSSHYHDIQDVISSSPKGIILEKPVSDDPRQGEEILQKMNHRSIPFVVNFLRRWHSGCDFVRKKQQEGFLTQPVTVQTQFTGEPLNQMVHDIDLFCWLFGTEWSVDIESTNDKNLILTGKDGAQVKFSYHSFMNLSYRLREMNFYCREGTISTKGGIERFEVRLVQDDPIFPGFQVPRQEFSRTMMDEPILVKMLNELDDRIKSDEYAEEMGHFEMESWRICSEIIF